MSSPANNASVPPAIPNHDLLRLVARGNYGEIWLAKNVLGSFRAVKILWKHDFPDERPFEREFAGVTNFEPISRTNEGLVDILHIGRDEELGFFFYVMEVADDCETGQDIRPEKYQPRTLLSERLKRGRLPARECVDLLLPICGAVAHLHNHNLVHRDLKPANIIFINGLPRIADVGLVAVRGPEGSIVGTEGFFPRCGQGQPSGDVYALGKVLYELSTGFECSKFPKLPAELATPDPEFQDLNSILLKACEARSEDRYRTAEDLYRHLSFLRARKSVGLMLKAERWYRLVRKFAPYAAAAAIALFSAAYLWISKRERMAEDQQRQAGAAVVAGTRALEDGDYFEALPWFVRALQLDQKDKVKVETHKLRIGTLLDRSPTVVKFWKASAHLERGELSPTGDKALLSTWAGSCQVLGLKENLLSNSWFGTDEAPQWSSYSRDGRYIISSGTNCTLNLRRANTTELFRQFHYTTNLYNAEISGDGSQIAAATHDHKILVWNVSKDEPVQKLEGHTGYVRTLAFSPDGNFLASGGNDQDLRVWDLHGGAELMRKHHSKWVFHIAFSPDGTKIATACFDQSVHVWNLATGTESFPRLLHTDGVTRVRFSPDGRWLLTASYDSTVRLWNATNGVLAPPILRHTSRVLDANFSRDGRFLLTVCWDGTVRLWNLDPLLRLPAPEKLQLTFDGQHTVTTKGRVVEIKETWSQKCIGSLTNDASESQKLLLSENCQTIVAFRTNTLSPSQGTITVRCNSGNVAPLAHWNLNEFPQASFLSPNGSFLVLGLKDSIDVYRPATGKKLAHIKISASVPNRVYFSRDEQLFAAISGHRVHVWRSENGNLVAGPLSHPGDVNHVEFAPRGDALVTACTDKSLEERAAFLWTIPGGKPLGRPLRHRDGVIKASFSPDGRFVVTAGEDFFACVWDVKTGRLIAEPMRHASQVFDAIFSANGEWILTIEISGVARLWDRQSGQPITPPFVHPLSIRQGFFAPGDKGFITRRLDGETRRWPLPRTKASIKDLTLLAQFLAARTEPPPVDWHWSVDLEPEKLWKELHPRFPSEYFGQR